MSDRRRDETGKFTSPKDKVRYRCIAVWDSDSEGETVAVRHGATERDLEELERMYGDDPMMEIRVEEY